MNMHPHYNTPGEMNPRHIGRRLRTASMLPKSILRNLWCARRLHPFPVARFENFCVEPLSASNLIAMTRLYASLNNKPIAPDKKMLLALLGPKLALVVRNGKSGEVVGLAFYYFNARDRLEGTIHVGYSGVIESLRGRGLGTFMRRHALASFATSGLAGVSTRISASNGVSWRVNEKLGFVIVETYFDDELKELRHYMVCGLDRFRNDTTQG